MSVGRGRLLPSWYLLWDSVYFFCMEHLTKQETNRTPFDFTTNKHSVGTWMLWIVGLVVGFILIRLLMDTLVHIPFALEDLVEKTTQYFNYH